MSRSGSGISVKANSETTTQHKSRGSLVKAEDLNLSYFFLYFIPKHVYHHVGLLSIAIDVA